MLKRQIGLRSADPRGTIGSMCHNFDRNYWETHWQDAPDPSSRLDAVAANPHIARETIGLTSGTALDAGCGTGAESVWLASHGWRVTDVDISASALSRAASRAAASAMREAVTWIEADLTTWEPDAGFDLVTTNYVISALEARPMPPHDRHPRLRW